MVQDTAIVTTADQYKVVHDLSIGAICDNLERPMAQIWKSEYLGNRTRYGHNYNGRRI